MQENGYLLSDRIPIVMGLPSPASQTHINDRESGLPLTVCDIF